MTNLSGSRIVKADDRLFTIIEFVAIFVDLSASTPFAWGLADRPPRVDETAGFDSNLFPVQVRLRPFGSYVEALQGKSRAEYELIFDPRDPAWKPPEGAQDFSGAARYIEMSELFYRAALVLFYERHVDWINSQERDVEKRSEILRFAWLLRGAAAHRGPLNMTDDRRKPFTWHHLSFDHTNATFKVFEGSTQGASAMSVGDILIFLCELSDELDRLGCPQM